MPSATGFAWRVVPANDRSLVRSIWTCPDVVSGDSHALGRRRDGTNVWFVLGVHRRDGGLGSRADDHAVVAVIFAAPLATGVALYISEYAPRRLRRALINTVGLMAAVPSMVFGLWCFYLLTRCSSCTG